MSEKMKIKVTRTITKEIERCMDCPFKGNDGNVMMCQHPSLAEDINEQYIISHPECDNGFPELCPLLNKETK